MTIRFRLSSRYTFITVTLFLLFALNIYWAAQRDRANEFFAVLRQEALTKANLYFRAKIPVETLQQIYRNNRQLLSEVEVAIYSSGFELLYHDALDIDVVKESPQMIERINKFGDLQFYQDDWQVLGLSYDWEGQRYYIFATAYDRYGYRKMDRLRQNMLWSAVFFLLLIFWAGYFFATQALLPLRQMTAKVQAISASNLHWRLPLGKYRDELGQLAHTLNELLDRLENSFEAQKLFVSNLSHELRTPLAALITELEWRLSHPREAQADQQTLENILRDAKKMAGLYKSLLDLAKASYDPSQIHFKLLRIDELLLDAQSDVLSHQTHYKIKLEFETVPEIQTPLLVWGNEYLLRLACANLLDNACKFSPDQTCRVKIRTANQSIFLLFQDSGPGIAALEQDQLFKPFSKLSTHPQGYGIGLYLAHKIAQLHKGRLSYLAAQPQGAIFVLELPCGEEP
jgi:signal transduction histidine kinase